MSSPTSKNSARGSAIVTALVLLTCAVTLMLVAANRQAISDWIRLRGYAPSNAVAGLAAQDGMNGYTTHLFYLNRPKLLSSVSSFRQECPDNENTIVLGCYHPGENGIGIYKVDDPKLSGVEQVTAAHEVLHAIYERLDDADRQSLNGRLQDFYEHGLSDPRVRAEIKLYQKTEPNDVLNEMSCVFGTEVANLPPELEAYYSRYFTDRSTIVKYGQKYEGEFSRRQALIKQYDASLAALKTRIDAAKADLDAKLAELHARQSELAAERGSDTSAYNAGVPAYNLLVDEYNVEISSTQALIDQYNRLVVTRNKVAGELAGLAKALDTRLVPESGR